MIAVQDLRKHFGLTRAVDGISFQVRRGEILGFLGPNGAGKSTALRVITGYIAADAGTVRVAGIDVAEHPLEAQKRIGYLPESLPLYWEMQVDEYLRFIAGSRRMARAEARSRIDGVVELLGLGRMRKRPTGSLSKGFRQRVGLAQALLHDPDILIMDEPTNGLDPQQIVEIRALIRRLAETKAILFSTHILQEISAICSRIMVIREGRIIANDTLEALARANGSSFLEIVLSGAEEPPPELLDALGFGPPLASESRGAKRLLRFEGGGGDPDVGEISSRISEHERRLLELRVRPDENLEEVYLRLTSGTGARGGS
ncbi:MAG: ABC transporter ATP-binding protein [Planctomycetota bacterium]